MPLTPITGNGSDKLAPKQDNKSQQKSEKKPETSSSNSSKHPLLLPAVTTTSWPSHPHPQPPFLISWVNMVSFLLKNIKDTSTTIFVCTVVVLATRLLTARKWLPPLPRLKPVQLRSRKKRRRNHQKKAMQLSGLHTAWGLHYSFLCHYGGSPL